MADFWLELGFRENPYAVRPLPANDDGRQLLVGRDDELRRLSRKLGNSDLHPVLEGSNGVGKTSLVAVAAHELSRESREGRSQQLYLSLGEPLQMSEDTTDLTRKVYFQIAQALLTHYDTLRAAGRGIPGREEIQTWLNAPTYRSAKGGGVNTPLGGTNASWGTAVNTSFGFTESGFPNAVRQWLEAAFPGNTGGFIGTLDNLELLDTSRAAARVLEEIRDPILQLHGVRWVLCGARGIARGLANTLRLNGFIAEPMDVLPIRDNRIPDLIDARIKVFALEPSSHVNAPVNAEAFAYLYEVSGQNLRDSLSYAQDFALDHEPDFFLAQDVEDIASKLREWIDKKAEMAARDVSLTARMWKLLGDLVGAGGIAAPSDFERFGFNDRGHMRKYVVELERYSLVHSSVEAEDSRRRSIAVTDKGAMVHHAQRRNLLAQGALDLSTQTDGAS